MSPHHRAALRLIGAVLKEAAAHSDGRSIVSVSPIRLQRWGEALEEMARVRQRQRPGKSMLHLHWALQYWCWRAGAPADVAGAIRNVQFFTGNAFLFEQRPGPETVLRVARRYRNDVLDMLESSGADLKALRAELSRHSKRGRS